jgi:VRR-NUC domain
LSLRGLYFVTPRSDKRSTIKPGHPDFSIFHAGKVLFVEMKTQTGRLSDEQEQCIAELTAKRFPVVIARNALEAIQATREFVGGENGTETTISPYEVGTLVGTP